MVNKTPVSDDATAAGASIYSKPLLSIYDLWVLGFSNTYVWRCPTQLILEFYNEHVSGNHLDVGVGTGYFLDKCRYPIANPTIALADLNENSLHATASRLKRYQPKVYVANVLEPMEIEPAEFDTIGLNYLLHCLPGDINNKAVSIRNLKPLMNPDGAVMFGSTILGVGVRHNLLGRMLMRAYNKRQVFCNLADSAADLEGVLAQEFREYRLRVVGCVGLFMGRT